MCQLDSNTPAIAVECSVRLSSQFDVSPTSSVQDKTPPELEPAVRVPRSRNTGIWLILAAQLAWPLIVLGLVQRFPGPNLAAAVASEAPATGPAVASESAGSNGDQQSTVFWDQPAPARVKIKLVIPADEVTPAAAADKAGVESDAAAEVSPAGVAMRPTSPQR